MSDEHEEVWMVADLRRELLDARKALAERDALVEAQAHALVMRDERIDLGASENDTLREHVRLLREALEQVQSATRDESISVADTMEAVDEALRATEPK